MNFKPIVVGLLSIIFSCCNGKPPTPHGKQLLNRIEAYKAKTGNYPKTIEGNLADTDSRAWNITTNSFFYIPDSAGTSYTLKVYNGEGLSDVYESKTKQWVRSDK